MNNRCEESINGDVSLEMCCNTIGKGWGSPCEECPPRKGGKRYFVLVASSCTSWSQSALAFLSQFSLFLFSFSSSRYCATRGFDAYADWICATDPHLGSLMLFLSEVAQMKREISSTCTSAPQLTA